MAKSNGNLHKAKKEKNDEFYTLYEDIEKEIKNYDLKGKWVYSPFDDYRKANFVKYFKNNFEILGLKHYTATCINNGDGAWRYDYDGEKEVIQRIDDGDYACPYCTAIKNACDIVISNPPFSQFRKIIKWLEEE